MINRKKRQQRTKHVPCGPPLLTSMKIRVSETETLITRPIRKSAIQFISGLQIPNNLNLSNNKWCETTSKAIAKSNKTTSLLKPISYHFDTIPYVKIRPSNKVPIVTSPHLTNDLFSSL